MIPQILAFVDICLRYSILFRRQRLPNTFTYISLPIHFNQYDREGWRSLLLHLIYRLSDRFKVLVHIAADDSYYESLSI